MKQTFSSFELIVVDDGSTDKTEALIQEISDQRLIYLKQKNRGVSSARNFGCSRARGKWICFLDSDDEWMPTKLQKQFEFISNHPQFIWNHTEEIWNRNGKRVNPKKRHQKQGGDLLMASFELCLVSPSTVCIRRDIFEIYEGFDETLEVCEDYDLWLRIIARYPIGYLSEKLIVKYGGHADQLSAKLPAMDYFRLYSMHKLITQQAENLNVARKSALKNIFRQKYEVLENGYLKRNNTKKLLEIKAWYSDIFVLT